MVVSQTVAQTRLPVLGRNKKTRFAARDYEKAANLVSRKVNG